MTLKHKLILILSNIQVINTTTQTIHTSPPNFGIYTRFLNFYVHIRRNRRIREELKNTHIRLPVVEVFYPTWLAFLKLCQSKGLILTHSKLPHERHRKTKKVILELKDTKILYWHGGSLTEDTEVYICHYPIPNNDLLSFNSCNITWRAGSIF